MALTAVIRPSCGIKRMAFIMAPQSPEKMGRLPVINKKKFDTAELSTDLETRFAGQPTNFYGVHS